MNAKNVTIDEVANEANRVSALTKTECAISNVDEDEFNNSDIDLNASYSDSDNEIPIEEKKFWDYLTKLEENNLFEMNLFQDRN